MGAHLLHALGPSARRPHHDRRSVGNPRSRGGTCVRLGVFQWTGAAGDHQWSTAENWADTDGVHRVPTSADGVCIDRTVNSPVVIAAPAEAAHVDLTGGTGSDVALRIRSTLTLAHGGGFDAPVRLESGASGPPRMLAHGRDHLIFGNRFEVGADAGGAVVDADITGFFGLVDLQGDTAIDGSVEFHGSSSVRPGVHLLFGRRPVTPTVPADVVFWERGFAIGEGALVTNDEPALVTVGLTASLSGAPPVFRNATIFSTGRADLIALGRTAFEWTSAQTNLRVFDDPVSGQPAELIGTAPDYPTRTSPARNLGTIELLHSGAGARSATFTTGLDNKGTLRLRNVVVAGRLINSGSVEENDLVWWTQDGPGRVPNENRAGGRIELSHERPDPLFFFTGGLQNDGTIGGDIGEFGAGLLIVSDGTYSGTGAVQVPLSILRGSIDSGGFRSYRLPGYIQARSTLTLDVAGPAIDRAERLRIDGAFDAHEPAVAPSHDVELRLGDGYVPCPGIRFAVLSWGDLLPPSSGPGVAGFSVAATGGPSWLSFRTEVVGHQLVAVAQGDPAGRPCSDTSNQVFVSSAFVDLFGRQVDRSALRFWAGRLDGDATRRSVAAALTASGEYRRTVVMGEYQRILSAVPGSDELASWMESLGAGRSVDALRTSLLVDPRFAPGADDARWIDAVYRSELGRPVDSGGRTWALRRLSAGDSRSQVAAIVLRSNEADSHLVDRWSIELLGRAATTAERAAWVGALRSGAPERSVTVTILASPDYPP